MTRPEFNSISSFEEFSKYYWYRDELLAICRKLGVSSNGGKHELEDIIRQHFEGTLDAAKLNKAGTRKAARRTSSNADKPYTSNTSVVLSGFTCGRAGREYFEKATGIVPFHFTADMVACIKKAHQENDTSFTLGDLADVFYGKKTYAVYDKSVCQWNQFLKDYFADRGKNGSAKEARALWKKVRDSDKPNIYTPELLAKAGAVTATQPKQGEAENAGRDTETL